MADILKYQAADIGREFQSSRRRSFLRTKHAAKKDSSAKCPIAKKFTTFVKKRCKLCRQKCTLFVSQRVKNASVGVNRHQVRRIYCSEQSAPTDDASDYRPPSCCRRKLRVLNGRRKRQRTEEHSEEINEAFTTLRGILPLADEPEEDDPAAAKVSTLRLAASYIQALSDMLRETHLSDGGTSGFDVEHNYSYLPTHCHGSAEITINERSDSLVSTCQ